MSGQFNGRFIDLKDPSSVAANVARDDASANSVHIDLASDIVKALFSKDIGSKCFYGFHQ